MSENHPLPSICVVCDNDLRYPQADSFSSQHQLKLLREKDPAYELQLVYNEQKIELYDTRLNTSIDVDFVHGALAHRQQFGGGRGQAIARAVGLKQGNRPSVLDATAGLARDAYVLAMLGCRVTLIEQSPILSLLIEDGIQRAQQNETTAVTIAGHFRLYNMNAVDYMRSHGNQRPDVVYLDPMFPERKKSALVKKDMQILQHLLGKDDDEQLLLETALGFARKRVVVKRPKNAPHLANRKPSTSISSKKTRYDIYIIMGT